MTSRLTTFLYFAYFAIAGSAVYAAWKSGVPWVPARTSDLDRILKLIDSKPSLKIVDIGAGDAKVLSHLAKNLSTRAEFTGYELSLFPYLLGKIRLLFNRQSRKIKYTFADLTKKELNSFDVVYCFLMPAFLGKLRPKFEKELKPGARLISYVFEVPGWTPTVTDYPPEAKLPIYAYDMPVKT